MLLLYILFILAFFWETGFFNFLKFHEEFSTEMIHYLIVHEDSKKKNRHNFLLTTKIYKCEKDVSDW